MVGPTRQRQISFRQNWVWHLNPVFPKTYSRRLLLQVLSSSCSCLQKWVGGSSNFSWASLLLRTRLFSTRAAHNAMVFSSICSLWSAGSVPFSFLDFLVLCFQLWGWELSHTSATAPIVNHTYAFMVDGFWPDATLQALSYIESVTRLLRPNVLTAPVRILLSPIFPSWPKWCSTLWNSKITTAFTKNGSQLVLVRCKMATASQIITT